MGKDKTLPKFKPNQAGATAKYLRIPPRKARLVIDAVRGKYVTDALAILKFVPNFAAEAISDVIKSAVANAENSRPVDELTGRQMDPLITDNLKLVRAFIDEGPRIKRLQPRAQGRAYRILKRMCHITVIVEEVAPKPRPTRVQRPSRRTAQQAAGRPAAVTAPATAETPAPKEKAKVVTTPVEATVPEEETAAVENTTAVENTAPAAEETAAEVSEDDAKDEIGAPITTEADVEATNAKNEAGEDAHNSADTPKAE
jgi:large subunit ribosomal protein L22